MLPIAAKASEKFLHHRRLNFPEDGKMLPIAAKASKKHMSSSEGEQGTNKAQKTNPLKDFKSKPWYEPLVSAAAPHGWQAVISFSGTEIAVVGELWRETEKALGWKNSCFFDRESLKLIPGHELKQVGTDPANVATLHPNWKDIYHCAQLMVNVSRLGLFVIVGSSAAYFDSPNCRAELENLVSGPTHLRPKRVVIYSAPQSVKEKVLLVNAASGSDSTALGRFIKTAL
eukprot:g23675.t1